MNLKLVYILIFLLWSCDSVELPKPNAYLRLDFPSPLYKEANFEANGTTVELNTASTYFTKIKNISNSLISKTIFYPLINAEIKLEYYNLNRNNKLNHRLKNLNDFTSIHLKKSLKPPKIQEFINQNTKVYASIINIKGDVTSPYQFYATDSTKHFVTGSVYFYAKPNFDSIMPAASYIKNDMQRLMETLKWK